MLSCGSGALTTIIAQTSLGGNNDNVNLLKITFSEICQQYCLKNLSISDEASLFIIFLNQLIDHAS